jgi:acyl-CoA thioesterase YciA
MSDKGMGYRARRLVKHGDLNPNGTLFGGRMLEWIDEEAAIFAMCQLDSPKIVTAHMSDINFSSTAVLGEVVEIGCALVKIGRSSITVSCDVRNKNTKQSIISVGEIVFVHVGPDGKSAPHGKG